ncbi:hypothetical protein EV702DRAFT_1043403 [Suillus placidus]|uniref:Uncharacterized protein n=1 Tax=Suillus placidus TaxID=48579 RepID=A0A9P7D5S2_9AGAM|nr:hypothetical protein EV702DRAFT_1043403 [Suillus placidus]
MPSKMVGLSRCIGLGVGLGVGDGRAHISSAYFRCFCGLGLRNGIASNQANATANEQLYLGTKFSARLQKLYILLNVCHHCASNRNAIKIPKCEFCARGGLQAVRISSPDSSVHVPNPPGGYDSRVHDRPVGQPMAQILYNSLGKWGVLTLWCFVILAQYDLSARNVPID